MSSDFWIFLVEKLRQSDDWRAQAFLLERRWPSEFGRTTERRLPEEPQPVADLSRSFPMKLGLADSGTIDASEALRAFTSFPRRCSQCSKPLTHDDRPADDEPEHEHQTEPMKHRFSFDTGHAEPINGEHED